MFNPGDADKLLVKDKRRLPTTRYFEYMFCPYKDKHAYELLTKEGHILTDKCVEDVLLTLLKMIEEAKMKFGCISREYL